MTRGDSTRSRERRPPDDLREAPGWRHDAHGAAIALFEEKLERLWQERKSGARIGFPKMTRAGRWHYGDDWFSGFLSGAYWQLHALTGAEIWAERAREASAELAHWTMRGDFQDIGFILLFSSVVGYELTGDAALRGLALRGADSLKHARRPHGFLRCSWLPGGDDVNGVDSLMNSGLWVWAGETEPDGPYRGWAEAAIDFSARSLLRDDGGSYEYVEIDGESGAVLGARNRNASSNSAVWTRGHVWAIYGFSVAFSTWGRSQDLEACKHLLTFYLSFADLDSAPPWCLSDEGSVGLVDASAGAALASACLMLAGRVPEAEDQAFFRSAGTRLLAALTSEKYLARTVQHDGVLLHASSPLHVVGVLGESQIWGEYFLLEALSRYQRLIIIGHTAAQPNLRPLGRRDFDPGRHGVDR